MDYKKAAELKQAIKNNPHDPELLKKAAEYFLSAGLHDEALTYWNEYNSVAGGDAEALKTIGAILGQKGNHRSAKECFIKSLELDSNNADTYHNLAITLVNNGDLMGAVKNLEKSVHLNPRDKGGWNDLGVLFYETGNKKRAEECFYGSLNIDGEFRDPLLNLAQLKGEFHDKEKAIEVFRSYLNTHRDDEIEQIYNSIFPEIKQCSIDKFNGLKVCLTAFSDLETDPERKLRWGDYWFKKEFAEAFEKFGCEIVRDNADLLLHLFGVPMTNLPKAGIKLIWIHSHPDLVSSVLLKQYDRIFCLSNIFIPRIKRMGFDAELLIGGAAKKAVKSEKMHDIVFVGNTKGKTGRKIIRDLSGNYEGLKVWGEGWEGIIPEENICGIYYENQKLPELYASAKISLNDHHDDMLREGFLNPRVFDILASGGFVISDRMEGMGDIFGDSVPTYSGPAQLRELIDKYLSDDEARERLSAKGRAISSKYTFDKMASQVLESTFEYKLPHRKSSLTLKRPPEPVYRRERLVLQENGENSLRIFGMDIDGCDDFEILPVFNSYKFLSGIRKNLELHINGKPDCSLPAWARDDRSIKWVDDLNRCDVYIDCALKYSNTSNLPENISVILTPNIDDQFITNGDRLEMKIGTRLHLEYGRIWEFNDLVFAMGFAAKNCRNIIPESV